MALPEPSSTPPQRSLLRASDADRTRTIEALRQHTAEGRLTVEEFDQRVGEAYEARTLGELDRCGRDLPTRPAPEPTRSAPAIHHPRKNPHVVGFVTTSLLLVFIWLMSGGGYPWPLWAIVPMGLGTAKRVYAEEQ